MPKMFHRKKMQRSIFRKIAKGSEYWLASNTAVSSSTKYDQQNRLDGWTASTGLPTLTVVDGTTAVIKVPQCFTGQNNPNR